jgi:4-aminobutyrate aminotransferase-like enzyme
MDAWPPSGDEAIHTQTFLGHPPGCAAALASIAVIEEEKLVERAAENGAFALRQLRGSLENSPGIADLRGRGLLLAVECDTAQRAARACERSLARGVIALTSGDDGRVLSLAPPLSIEREILELALDIVAEALA